MAKGQMTCAVFEVCMHRQADDHGMQCSCISMICSTQANLDKPYSTATAALQPCAEPVHANAGHAGSKQPSCCSAMQVTTPESRAGVHV